MEITDGVKLTKRALWNSTCRLQHPNLFISASGIICSFQHQASGITQAQIMYTLYMPDTGQLCVNFPLRVGRGNNNIMPLLFPALHFTVWSFLCTTGGTSLLLQLINYKRGNKNIMPLLFPALHFTIWSSFRTTGGTSLLLQLINYKKGQQEYNATAIPCTAFHNLIILSHHRWYQPSTAAYEL